MFLDTSFIIFGLFIILLLLTGLYVWRRINSLESYNKVLEKKVNHMKKENKELKELLYGNGEDDINDSDVIMNKIFNTDVCSVTSVCCDIPKCEKPTTKVSCNDDKCMIVEDTSDIVQNIIAESTETKPIIHTTSFNTFPKPVVQPISSQQSVETAAISLQDTSMPPVVQHVDDNDIESVISDAVSGLATAPYNRKKLSKMNLDKLKEICTSMQLSVEGTKNVLIDRILSNLTLE
jgi:hypothetical protein